VGKIQKVFEVLELRAAVVEAARKHVRHKESCASLNTSGVDWSIYYAIEALERAEKGER
jgi:hypothetical protein